MKQEIIRLDRVTLERDGAVLLDGINLHIFEGEILGLVCINAYGQDELVHLMCRNEPIHYGYVYFQEALVNSYRRSSGSENRVAVIGDKSRLVGDLSVADNIFVLRRGFKKYVISPRTLAAQLRRFTDEFGIELDANERAGNLTGFEQCVVELLRAVITGVRLVVMRDVSNIVGPADLVRLQALLRRCAAGGMSFLYVCNHHEECFSVCDRLALMENGRVRKVLDRENFWDEIISHFTLDFCNAPTAPLDRVGHNGILKFRHVKAGAIRDMSFVVERGECVVMLDMNNTALADVMRVMSGERHLEDGQILVEGRDWRAHRRELAWELAFIRENPTKTMLFREMSFVDNLCFALDRRELGLWLGRRMKRSVQQEYLPLVGDAVYARDITKLPPSSLYDLVYYRVHLYHPKVVFIAQPFAGADMYLRHHIIKLIRELCHRKITVVILAVSLSDCLNVADRVLLLENGCLTREYGGKEMQQLGPGWSGPQWQKDGELTSE